MARLMTFCPYDGQAGGLVRSYQLGHLGGTVVEGLCVSYNDRFTPTFLFAYAFGSLTLDYAMGSGGLPILLNVGYHGVQISVSNMLTLRAPSSCIS